MKIFNTMQRKKEEFTPLEQKKIKMYTCGQTVYNDIHIGNARFYVVFDAIRRYLLHKGYDVNYVQNFTDIDDKIIIKALEENCTTDEIAEKYIASTREDLVNLNVLPATTNPRATQEVPEIIALITDLIAKGYAYENNGTVYYSVEKFEGYGKLSRKKTEDLEAGARIEVEAGKRNPMDFVLWKPAKPNEPKWSSPWSEGRPGWHIECSAMAKKYLGDQIDIHGGGVDLIFPHHENEIAQTEAVTGKDFANFWLHCGSLTNDHKKMSKSRGNFFTYREVAEKFPHDVIRFYLLSGHYRMPMEFTDEALKAAAQGLKRIKTCHQNLLHAENEAPENADYTCKKSSHSTDFFNAMEDDFNTADAITAIFELVKEINTCLADTKTHPKKHYADMREELEKLCGILGITLAQTFTQNDKANDDQIEALIAARGEARAAKNFAEADRIRDEIAAMGIILEDTPGGVRWKRA
ncbi:MAG: cysteine--tRNA ligase [Defluviitaleaceae bacterium]|nr:cysteine--tRNA ligase [Defluviitaleaceae bacterium]